MRWGHTKGVDEWLNLDGSWNDGDAPTIMANGVPNPDLVDNNRTVISASDPVRAIRGDVLKIKPTPADGTSAMMKMATVSSNTAPAWRSLAA